MKELVQLQSELHELAKSVKEVEKRVVELEKKMEKNVTIIRAEAKQVLEKAAAIVNPYSPSTMTYDHKTGGSQ